MTYYAISAKLASFDDMRANIRSGGFETRSCHTHARIVPDRDQKENAISVPITWVFFQSSPERFSFRR